MPVRLMHRMALLRQMVNRLAKLYGHDLKPWQDETNLSKDYAECKLCGKRAVIEVYGFGTNNHSVSGEVMQPCNRRK